MFIILSAAQTYIARFRIKELHQVLKRLGLSIGGLKTALVQRLVNYISRPGGRAAVGSEDADRVREVASALLAANGPAALISTEYARCRRYGICVISDSLSLWRKRSAGSHDGAACLCFYFAHSCHSHLGLRTPPHLKRERATLMSGSCVQRTLCAKCTCSHSSRIQLLFSFSQTHRLA